MSSTPIVLSPSAILTRGKKGKFYDVIDCEAIRNRPKIEPKPTLPSLSQEVEFLLSEKRLEICPYIRNARVELETPRVYGQCSLTSCYDNCPRHKIDPIGQPGCYRYKQIWDAENAEKIANLNVTGLLKVIDTKSS